MRFGIREICDVVLRAKATQTLGSRKFYKNEPVLYFETLKTSSLEGAATTVYAQGGRGNTRLVAWEGERTLTFTMEDALLSMESFSILSGAGLMDASEEKPIYVHQTSQVEVKDANTVVIPDIACWNGFKDKNNDFYHTGADIFIMVLKNGEVNTEPCIPVEVKHDMVRKETIMTCYSHKGVLPKDAVVLVDYYVKRTGGAQEITIDAEKFGGNYYLEASTLFRRESDGVDMPAEFIIPNCKVQSNFSFSLASTGDPSTFTFTMDAFPDYTKFDPTRKVLAAIQVITGEEDENEVEDKRQACHENVISYESPAGKIRADFVANGTAKAIVNVTGEVDGQAYNTDWYGTSIPQGAQISIQVPVAADDTEYEIVTTNPAYSKYFVGNPGITGNTKRQTAKGADIAEGIALILAGDTPGDVTLEVSDMNDNFKKSYTVYNNITFGTVSGATVISVDDE